MPRRLPNIAFITKALKSNLKNKNIAKCFEKNIYEKFNKNVFSGDKFELYYNLFYQIQISFLYYFLAVITKNFGFTTIIFLNKVCFTKIYNFISDRTNSIVTFYK